MTEQRFQRQSGPEPVINVKKLIGLMSHQCGPDCAFPDLEHITEEEAAAIRAASKRKGGSYE